MVVPAYQTPRLTNMFQGSVVSHVTVQSKYNSSRKEIKSTKTTWFLHIPNMYNSACNSCNLRCVRALSPIAVRRTLKSIFKQFIIRIERIYLCHNKMIIVYILLTKAMLVAISAGRRNQKK